MKTRIDEYGDSVHSHPGALDGRGPAERRPGGRTTEGERSALVEPILDKSLSLDALLDAMKPETFHDDIDFGALAGGEVW